MDTRDLILIICSLGAIQSLFWGMYFIFIKKAPNSKYLLSGLFIALAIRIVKSTLFIFSDSISLSIINIGFAAHLTIAPFLYFYIQWTTTGNRPSFRKLDLVHFLPAAVILIGLNLISLDGFWYRGGYAVLLFQSLPYIWLSSRRLYTGPKHLLKTQGNWNSILFIAVSIVLLAYFSNYILRFNSYLSGPIIYAGVIYVMSFYLLKHLPSLFGNTTKYKNINLSKSQSITYAQKIREYCSSNEPYLQNDFSLAQLSTELKIPKHILSNVFSEELNMSFTEFVNSHRIEAAKIKLKENQHLTVSSIAYDCGFNTLSAFNQAFKKFVNTTPSKFRGS